MSRRVIIFAFLVVVASLTGVHYAPAETQAKIHRQFSVAKDLMATFYTWCSEQPYVTLAKERLGPFVTSFTEKISKTAMDSTFFGDAKAYALGKFVDMSTWAAMNFLTFADAKAYAVVKYTEVLTLAKNSTLFADAKANAFVKYAEISTAAAGYSDAAGLSFEHMLLVIGSSFLLLIVFCFWQCRRKARGVMDTTAAAHVQDIPLEYPSQDVPLECQTETQANVMSFSSSVSHKRRSRCDSPGPVGNEENEKPHMNCNSITSEEFFQKVNIATNEELLTFPGLGRVSVEKILKYRSNHGEIQNFEELIAKVGLSKVTVSRVAKLHGC